MQAGCVDGTEWQQLTFSHSQRFWLHYLFTAAHVYPPQQFWSACTEMKHHETDGEEKDIKRREAGLAISTCSCVLAGWQAVTLLARFNRFYWECPCCYCVRIERQPHWIYFWCITGEVVFDICAVTICCIILLFCVQYGCRLRHIHSGAHFLYDNSVVIAQLKISGPTPDNYEPRICCK